MSHVHLISSYSTSCSKKMLLLAYYFIIATFFMTFKAEWVEITQKLTTSKPNQSKSGIRILKRTETDQLDEKQNTTPSPKWIEYQRERFGNFENYESINTQQLIVTGENSLKNSLKIIVPARNEHGEVNRHQIIQTKTRMNVVNDKPKEKLVEIPHSEPQTTTTKRDMNDAVGSDYVDYTDGDDDAEAEEGVNASQSSNKPSESLIQLPSLQGFLNFLKRLRKNWLKKSVLNIEEKIQALKDLRDNLMRKIEDKFFALWTPKVHLRRKRGILDESTIQFPPEAALMSINFLTFAVFLIKLALQIVHIIRSKHYNFTGLNVSTQLFGKTTLRP